MFKVTKYKVRREDLQDAIIAGIVFVAIVVFFIERHRREGGCTNCQQSESAPQGEEGHGLDDLLTFFDSHVNIPQVSLTPLTVEQIRQGAL